MIEKTKIEILRDACEKGLSKLEHYGLWHDTQDVMRKALEITASAVNPPLPKGGSVTAPPKKVIETLKWTVKDRYVTQPFDADGWASGSIATALNDRVNDGYELKQIVTVTNPFSGDVLYYGLFEFDSGVKL